MGQLLNLGRRVELISMDPHCSDISISLYDALDGTGAHNFVVHTYSAQNGVPARIDFAVNAMKTLGGMVPAAQYSDRISFTCGASHHAAVRRLFTEACKVAPGSIIKRRPMQAFDKKNNLTIEATRIDAGRYQISTTSEGAVEKRRIDGVTRGLIKLAEMQPHETHNQAKFPCGHNHDELVGLLLGRALNVRAAMREAEEASNRGILAAPSSQT